MQRDGERLVYSASDVTNFVECAHLTEIDRRVVLGELAWERSRSLDVEILARYGMAHEASYLDRLVAGGAEVVQVETGPGVSAMRRAVAETGAAMRSGASVIYQAALMNDCFGGYADFLMRVERPSALGEWAYEPLDTKLARRVQPYFLVQLCFYAGLISELQGAPPEHVRVLLGSGEEASYRLADFSAYYRAVERRFVHTMAEPGRSTYPEPVEHCPVCRWSEHCQAQRVADDHLSLVAWMHREQAARLRMAGVHTLADLGRSAKGARIPRMAQPTFEALRSQASLQLAERESGVPSIELLPPKPERGLAQLPEPDEGDIFFDMEGDPYIEGGLEYLFGVCFRTHGELHFRAFWAHSRAEERHAFEQLIDFIFERRATHPRMHVYHYASYERTALRRLMGLHATRESEVDDLMRGEVLVDLFQVVRQALRVSKPSYSIKELEAFYMDGRNAAVKDAGGSIVAYEEWLQNHDAVVLEGIERYNEEDCRSTALLLDWLHQRRLDAMRRFGEDIPWRTPPEPRVPDPSDDSDEAERVSRDLLAGLPEDVAELSDEQRARYLLGHVLAYHRREAKPTWWWYFDRRKQTGGALIDDHESIGGLELTVQGARALAASSGQHLNHNVFPMFFTGDLYAEFVLVHLNPKQDEDHSELHAGRFEFESFADYFEGHHRVGAHHYGPDAPGRHYARFDAKQVVFARPFGVIDFVEETTPAARLVNLERVVDRKLQMELIPYRSPNFRTSRFTVPLIRGHFDRVLRVISHKPRRYVLFCGGAFEPPLRHAVVNEHEFRLTRKDGQPDGMQSRFANLRIPFDGRVVSAGLCHSWPRQGLPMGLRRRGPRALPTVADIAVS